MNTDNHSQASNRPMSALKTIIIKDIELRIPEQRKLPIARKYQVEFSVDDTSRMTKKKKERNNLASWNESLFFGGEERSTLVVKVHQRHRTRKDILVGSFTSTVRSVLEKLKDGVLEEPLPNRDGSGHSELTIKFAVVANMAGDINTNELQATHAVIEATEAIGILVSTPAAAKALSTAVNIGSSVVTGLKASNQTFGVLLQRIELFDNLVASIAQLHPYTSLAWSVLSAANKVLTNQRDRDDQIVRLAGTMTDVFSFVNDAEPLKAIKAHVKTVTLLIQQVTECGYFITEYAKQKNFWIRTAKYTLSDIDARITDYENKLQELKTSFLEGVTVQTGVTVVRMMNTVEHAVESIDLNDMPYAFGARYAEEKGCLSGTRESFLREICDVLNNPDENAARVCLLTGVAGSGKSAVAHSIARRYDEQQRLGSSYCFSSTDIARRNPQNLFSTIARDLSDHDPQYKSVLWGIVKDNRALRTSPSPFEQIKRLIVEPSQHVDPIGPLIIVIDALDESGDQDSREQLLRAISQHISDNSLPINLRFLITARPESDIISAFTSASHLVRKQMGDILDEDVDDDIEKFIYHSLHSYSELETSWPHREWCRLLVQHSQHLFQWASTACRFIQGRGSTGVSPSKRLKTLLQDDSHAMIHPLDQLYRTVLGQLFTWNESQRSFQEVMAIVLALKEPLSLTALCALFETNEDLYVRDIIRPMGSLLDGVFDEGKPIRPLHTSFRDFLLDESRSTTFHVNIQSEHSLCLGRALLACMRNNLRFNICGLEDSRRRNSTVPDLRSRVRKAIPPQLMYACQYWMVHLEYGNPASDQDLLNEITSFFEEFFPYWLEAISLLSVFSPQLFILSAIENCAILRKWAKDHIVATLASEGFQFIQVFALVLKESTPHLYLSAMAQTPSNSPLCALWQSHLQKHIPITLEHPTNWPAEVHVMQGHSNAVSCVAYSPDGIHIVSGSWDGTIMTWNAASGQFVAGPFQGHSDTVYCVAYSPNGQQIVSGSWDKTIRIWNATGGQLLAGPLQGHTAAVYSVAYSPNGIYVASGSGDMTIRVWNVTSGQLVAGPFHGHTDEIWSVAYSPDGTHIISGSYDSTIRVWNATSGQLVVDPLQGHTKKVNSVAYSPDGTNIVSGSSDKTIRVWNAISGQLVAGPFHGHTQDIYSVAYSPNGIQIISGSRDATIQVWNATSGQSVASLLQGHTDTVLSIACSPDGTQIVSGSADNTIRVWNVTNSQFLPDSMQGHTKLIESVAYSPDGTYIASASEDMTVRVWNATSGQLVAGPFHGHASCINSIAYSPDGTCMVSASDDKTIRVWNSSGGQLVVDPFQGHTDEVHSVAYSPNGRYIVSGSKDSTIRVWNATSGQLALHPIQGHKGTVYSVIYSPHGTHIASGAEDNTVMVWNSTSGQLVADPFLGHRNTVYCLAYSPNGKCIVSGSRDTTIRVWNASSGQLVVNPFYGHTDSVHCVAYSPDGIHIVSGSEDSTIRIWSADSGQLIAGPFLGHGGLVHSIAYSPDGTHIVSGSYDRSIKVLKVQDLVPFTSSNIGDGWIESCNDNLFAWIAPWNRSHFCLPVHSLIISPMHIYHPPDVDRSLLGGSWISCWKD